MIKKIHSRVSQFLDFRLFVRQFNFESKNKVLMMNAVYLKHVKDEGKINISFRFVQKIDENKNVDRIFNFCRDLTEPIDVCMNRIKNNVEKAMLKEIKKKQKKNNPASESSTSNQELTVEFHNANGIIKEKSFADLLVDLENGSEYSLMLHQDSFTVKFNWPWINCLVLPSSILADFYVYPSKMEIDFADRHASEFIWYKGKLPNSQREDQIEWSEEIGRGFAVMIGPADVGYRLKVKAIPKSTCGTKIGPPVEGISKTNIGAGPGVCPFETRHLFTQERLSGKDFRVVSYNILADYYCDSDHTRETLFPYCPPYALQIDYRKQLCIKEIVGYNADIICLQEVDFKVFDLDLIPFLEEKQMIGIHNKKGTTPEGLATFWRTDRFELIENYGLNIGETAKTHPACQELWQKLQYNEKLVERVSVRSTTLQIAILRSKENPQKFVAVANTHLYFHPDADHVRLLQIGFSMILVEDFIKKFKEKSPDHENIGLIFCGDFNSVPECGIYKLMTENFVPEDFIDWNSNAEEAVKNVSLAQSFNMQSACGCPPFTNFTAGFQECLDYIFYQTEKFKVTRVIEMPSEEELKVHTAIPSVVFPSDHIAIISELEFLP